MSIKEFLVKKIAINKVCDKMVSEKTIDTIISHQFDSANAATATNNSIEKRGVKQMQKYTEQVSYYSKMLSSELTDVERRNAEMRLESVNNNVKALKPKLNEPSTNNRGMEE
jgi:hypothetical protein